MTDHSALAGASLVLGGNVFGWTADEKNSFAVLDAFYEAGGRMIDTADAYSAWLPGHVGGESERVIGNWLKARGVRRDMRIHTKCGMLSDGIVQPLGSSGDPELFHPTKVLELLSASLERLRTDYVDLLYAHRDFNQLEIGRIVEAFDGAVAGGGARAIGASNFTTERFATALAHAADSRRVPFTVLQNEYNLLRRDHYTPKLQNLCIESGIAMLPYSGLASGYLTGKYRSPKDFESGDRAFLTKSFAEVGPPVLAAMDAIADETGASLPAIALAWLRKQPGIAAPIASARTEEQVAPLIESMRLNLESGQLTRLTEAARNWAP